MKRVPWFEIILIVAVMSVSLYAALSDAQNFSLRWFTRDDAYYYFKVAQNISEGHGSTFDGINKTNGYHPLWMIICVPIFSLARFDLVLPLRILLIVMSGLSVWTAILLYRLLGKIFVPAVGAIAAAFWVFNLDILFNVYQQGLESGIAALCIVWFLSRLYEFERSWRTKTVTHKQLILLGLTGVLTIFSRLDLVFFVGIAGLWIVFRGHPLRYFLPLDIVIAVTSVFLAFILRLDLPAYYQFAKAALTMAGLAVAIKIPMAFLFGLYHPELFSRQKPFLFRLFASTTLSSIVIGISMLGITSLGSFDGFPRTVILLDFGLTLFAFGLIRLAHRGLGDKISVHATRANPLADFQSRFRGWLRDGLIFFGTAFGSLGVYMVYNKIAFGTFSPVSGQIKRWWGSFPARVYGGSTRSLLDFFGIAYDGDGLAWTPITNTLGDIAQQTSSLDRIVEARYLILLSITLLLFYVIFFLTKKRGKTAIIQLSLIPLVSGGILQAIYYHSGGYAAFKEWYWVSQRLGSVLIICLAAGLMFGFARKIRYSHQIAWTLALIVTLLMGQNYWNGVRSIMRYNRWTADTPMMEIAVLLEQTTEPGSLIGFTGGGNVGYFIQDRTIVNMDGLINSHEYFEALQQGVAGEFLEKIGLDYVLANPAILNQQPYDGQFNAFLTPTESSYGGKKLLQYLPAR